VTEGPTAVRAAVATSPRPHRPALLGATTQPTTKTVAEVVDGAPDPLEGRE
jgi:hypothetical protein